MSSLRNVIRRLRQKSSMWSRYLIEPINPTVPTRVGDTYFRRRSSWGLNARLCPCDVDFTHWIEHQGLAGKLIFHFGTGKHHHVGKRCHEVGKNEVLGVTASKREHDAYVQLVLSAPALAVSYKALFVDIYTLTQRALPRFDIVSLFHLGEFTPSPEKLAKGIVIHDDDTLLELFLSRLKPGGWLVCYPGSFGWPKVAGRVAKLVDQGTLAPGERFEHLLAFRTRAANEV